jgi:hypothetical protein
VLCAPLTSEGNATQAAAVNDGIVYLMVIPYILVAGIGYAIYRMKRTNRNRISVSKTIKQRNLSFKYTVCWLLKLMSEQFYFNPSTETLIVPLYFIGNQPDSLLIDFEIECLPSSICQKTPCIGE